MGEDKGYTISLKDGDDGKVGERGDRGGGEKDGGVREEREEGDRRERREIMLRGGRRINRVKMQKNKGYKKK